MATYPTEVSALLDALLTGTREALNDNLLGIYLRGSLALGGFDPETSDVDVLVVTHHPVSDSEFAALWDIHAQIGQRDSHYARTLEVSYIDCASLKRFEPGERRHPTVGADWSFRWADHRANWILERWIVREHGVTLAGPDPKTLIDPILPDEIREAARDELRARVSDWSGRKGVPDWLRPRYYQAFEVETVCRALYTISRGEIPTKPRAVEWALRELPDPWRTFVERSQDWRADKTEDTSALNELKAFVCWAAEEATADG